MSQPGAPAAYRGYKLQALHTLTRVLAPDVSDTLVFQPEGLEDLAIWEGKDRLVEAIQVKSYKNLVLSHLTPAKPRSFFHRAVELLRSSNPPFIKLVNFGLIGVEMHQAWAGDEPYRSRVTQKLRDSGFGERDIEVIFAGVELKQLDEAQEITTVFSFLQESLTGVDPESAFDILNFWLYRVAEQQGTITRSDLIERISSIGRFLAERRTYHSEWFVSITPIVDLSISDDQRSLLQEEFYAGVAARYEHILAELDFLRENKLSEIRKAFESYRVVVVHAASGQGKTTLAYRYLHDFYPEKWRFFVELIEDRQHALRIARALAGHANAVQAPMAIFLDISPRDTDWSELVKRLARNPQLHILVAIREEDYRRANVSGIEFNFTPVELAFDEAEARLIYERAIASGSSVEFLDFDDAWNRFGGDGPLLEFVYLLTQTTTLRGRLQEQVNRLRGEVRGLRAHPDELELLRLVSVASAYEARLSIPELISALNIPNPDYTLQLFEKEYLIRLSSDRRSVEGLHPIRSTILTDLVTSPDAAWIEKATRALPLMIGDDIESFILHAFVDRPSERGQLLEVVRQLSPTTWTGLAGVLRALLWVGVFNYIESNLDTIKAAYDEFGSGWEFIVDLDFTDIAGKELDKWWTRLEDLFPVERQARFEEIRASQTTKEEALELAAAWFVCMEGRPLSPVSGADWSGAAELCFWGSRLGVEPQVDQWLTDDDLTRAANELDLPSLADLSLALYWCNKERHAEWIEGNKHPIQARLAEEYSILSLEERESILHTNFLPSIVRVAGETSETASREGQTSSDPLHDETLDRIRLVRGLFPKYEAYGSQGYGYRLGSLQSPFDDSTTKQGIPTSHLPPIWAVKINSVAKGLGQNRFRPETWAEYVERVLEMRRLVVACLEELTRGLARYLQRSKAIEVREYIDMAEWYRCHASTNEPPLLPRTAVDQWGFAHEGASGQYDQSLKQQSYLPRSVALQKYTVFLKTQRDYTFSLSNFLRQSLHVMILNYHVGKMPSYSAERENLIKELLQKGLKIESARLSTYNLAEAKGELSRYQSQFRALFGHLVSDGELIALEEGERDVMSVVWPLWFFFAQNPGQEWAAPFKQIKGRINLSKRQLEKKIQNAIDKVASKETNINIIPAEGGWEEEPTLWLRLDLRNPIELYAKFEELVLALRETIGPVDFQEIAYHLIEENWRYIAVLPVIQGKMLDRSAWRLHTLGTALNRSTTETDGWSYVPLPIPVANWDELGLSVWGVEDIVMANRLSEAVAEISILAAQIADLGDVADVTEAGQQVLQEFAVQRIERMNTLLGPLLDAQQAMIRRFEQLPEKDKEARENLQEAIAGFSEMLQFMRPAADFDDEQEINVEQIIGLAKCLERARELAEGVRLLWIADVLDHLTATA